METLANINGNANSNFNNMKNINVTAASQQVAGNRAEEQEEKTNLRVIKIKPVISVQAVIDVTVDSRIAGSISSVPFHSIQVIHTLVITF